ncbi:MAG TPA: hypothetical protein VIK40_11930 [Geomonas sp.]
MKRLATLLLAISLCTGCATPQKGESFGFMQRYNGSNRLASAVALLDKDDSPGAAKVLEAICASKPVPGVTDEALFRLALLSLKPSAERPASTKAHQLLRRLKKEFPSSPWTAQAAPLTELINAAEELRRQNKSYKATNQSQAKEINELNRNIEQLNSSIDQLKHLDLELEKKSR